MPPKTDKAPVGQPTAETNVWLSISDEVGARVGAVLAAADDEGTRLRCGASKRIDHLLAETNLYSALTRARADAEAYASHAWALRSAAAILRVARHNAEGVVKESDQHAHACSSQTAALFENTCTTMALQTTAVETALHERDLKVTESFQQDLAVLEADLSAAHDRVHVAYAKEDLLIAQTMTWSTQHLANARQRAEEIIEQATVRSRQIREQSDLDSARIEQLKLNFETELRKSSQIVEELVIPPAQ